MPNLKGDMSCWFSGGWSFGLMIPNVLYVACKCLSNDTFCVKNEVFVKGERHKKKKSVSQIWMEKCAAISVQTTQNLQLISSHYLGPAYRCTCLSHLLACKTSTKLVIFYQLEFQKWPFCYYYQIWYFH